MIAILNYIILSLMAVSVVLFCVGIFIILFFKEKKAIGIKMLTYSAIIFAIGFGTCVAGLSFI